MFSAQNKPSAEVSSLCLEQTLRYTGRVVGVTDAKRLEKVNIDHEIILVQNKEVHNP